MEPDGLRTFIDDVGRMVSSTDDEYEITKRVAERLSDLLAGGYRLPPEVTRPTPVHHVTYPLYIAPDGSWSMASVVWDVGQRTPVHSHETWGVVGIYSGAEHEVRYVKPMASTAGAVGTAPREARLNCAATGSGGRVRMSRTTEYLRPRTLLAIGAEILPREH